MLVGRAGLGNGICAVVALLAHVGAEGFVVDFVAVLALHGRAYLFGELHLGLALHADGVVGGAEGGQEVGFRHFVHLALHHHDVVVGCAYHELHVGAFKLLEGGVDNKLAIDAGHSLTSEMGPSKGMSLTARAAEAARPASASGISTPSVE